MIHFDVKSLVQDACHEQDILCEKVILFGSRARGDYDVSSDYDFLIIINKDIDIKHRRALAKKVREVLAKRLIGADIIVKSTQETIYYKDKVWSSVRNALKEGVVL